MKYRTTFLWRGPDPKMIGLYGWLIYWPARKGPDAPAVLTIQDGILKQVRTGQVSLTTTRIVIDIEKIDDYKIFSLYSPYRLIIDARGETHERNKHPPLTTSAALVKPSQEQPITIMLDPGHGGKRVPGGVKTALWRKMLAISQRLGRGCRRDSQSR
jgi:N-acetylmuramoyl-L-alanine amidase